MAKAARRKKTRIIWAVDVYGSSPEFFKKSAEWLISISQKMNATIKPVFILSPKSLNLAIDIIVPPDLKRFETQSYKLFEKRMKNIKISNLEEPKVISHDDFSVKKSVNRLISFAKSSKGDMIFVNSHGRKGIPRFFLGSFAETLMMYSNIPVFVTNPKSKFSKNFSPILFPTDFSAASKKAFGKTIGLAKILSSDIILMHVTGSLRAAMAFRGSFYTDSAWQYYTKALEDIKVKKKKKLDSWASLGRKARVKVNPLIIESGESIADNIVEIATKKNVKLVALATTSGLIETALMGSHARQVVRYCPCPLWTVRAQR